MNQEHIGKFIAERRKEKNMTQQELAEQLKITDRAISNWENGKNMPDLSFFKPLCSILGITINELLSGEKIKESKYQEVLEENIINTVIYTKNKNNKKIVKYTGILSLILFLILGLLYIIDNNRMREGELALFSTWGNDYYHTFDNYDQKEIESQIKEYLFNNIKNKPNNNITPLNSINFLQIHTFFIEEVNDNEIKAYIWILEPTYHDDEKYINVYETTSRPYIIDLKKEEYNYQVINADTCEDDFFYFHFINNKFPKKIQKLAKDYYLSKEYRELQYDYILMVNAIYDKPDLESTYEE